MHRSGSAGGFRAPQQLSEDSIRPLGSGLDTRGAHKRTTEGLVAYGCAGVCLVLAILSICGAFVTQGNPVFLLGFAGSFFSMACVCLVFAIFAVLRGILREMRGG